MLPVLRNGTIAPATHAPVNRLSSIMDRLFDGFNAAPALPWHALPMSAWEEDECVRIEVDVPGMTEKDIEVTFNQGQLIIHGHRSCERRQGSFDTRNYGRFEQRMTLPCPVQADKVEASLANGVLSLSFPKAEEARPRRIELKSR